MDETSNALGPPGIFAPHEDPQDYRSAHLNSYTVIDLANKLTQFSLHVRPHERLEGSRFSAGTFPGRELFDLTYDASAQTVESTRDQFEELIPRIIEGFGDIYADLKDEEYEWIDSIDIVGMSAAANAIKVQLDTEDSPQLTQALKKTRTFIASLSTSDREDFLTSHAQRIPDDIVDGDDSLFIQITEVYLRIAEYVTVSHSLGFEAKNAMSYTVAPYLIQRVHEMADDGFPFPQDRLSQFANAFVNTRVDVDPLFLSGTKGFVDPFGWYDVASGHIIVKEPDTDFVNGDPRKPRRLVHEMMHSASGHTLSNLDPDTQEIDKSNARVRVGLHHIVGKIVDDEVVLTDRSQLLRQLNEAINETITRWVLSEERPNFSNMTCEIFFAGPSDVPDENYSHPVAFFKNAFQGMPIENMIRASFEDLSSYNKASERLPYRKLWLDDVAHQYRGGLAGIENGFNFHAVEYGTQQLLDAYRIEVAAGRYPANTVAEANMIKEIEDARQYQAMSDMYRREGWQREIVAARETGRPFHISQGHTENARIEDGPEPHRGIARNQESETSPEKSNTKETRDEGIAAARELFPTRTRDSNVPPTPDSPETTPTPTPQADTGLAL